MELDARPKCVGLPGVAVGGGARLTLFAAGLGGGAIDVLLPPIDGLVVEEALVEGVPLLELEAPVFGPEPNCFVGDFTGDYIC